MMQHFIGFIFQSLENLSAILTESLPENKFESFFGIFEKYFQNLKNQKT